MFFFSFRHFVQFAHDLIGFRFCWRFRGVLLSSCGSALSPKARLKPSKGDIVYGAITVQENNKIAQTSNSTAEKIKKKNVNDRIFKLSLTSPTNNTIAYKVIQSNSAVNSK
jgi:hypothetical protein